MSSASVRVGRAAPRADMRGRGWVLSPRGLCFGGVLILAVLFLELAWGAPRALAVVPPQLAVRAAGLIDADTGQQLYGVDGDAELPIASTTKIMTALVTLEHVDRLDTIFTQNHYEDLPGDSQIGLEPGDQMTVHDLLIALLLPSADDAAEDLAYNVGDGSIPRFIAMMNAQAVALGLTHTHYATPIGFDVPGNYSSPFDLDRLAAYTRAYSPLFRRITDLPSAVLRTGPMRHVVNRNDLVGEVPWVNGVKTGHTSGAGYCLVLSGTRDGMTLIGTVLGTSSEAARDANALALLKYGFAEFTLVHPVRAGAVIARPGVNGAPGGHAVVIAAAGLQRVVRRSDRVRRRILLRHDLIGPLALGTKVGRLQVLVDSRWAGTVPLVLGQALPAPPQTLTTSTVARVLLLVVFIGLIAFGLRRASAVRLTRRRRRERRRGMETG